MKPGDFVWYELCTSDPEAAAAFYSAVVGWTVRASGLPGIDYRLACVGDHNVAGIMTLPPEQRPPRPVWFGYIAVDDVDAKVVEVTAAGGSVHHAATDIPAIGRFAVVSDPQGAVFMLFRGIGTPPAPLKVMQAGSIGWHELHTSDLEAGWRFYERMFGWSKTSVHDMGPAGPYQLFETGASPLGGMFADAGTPHPHWLYYFAVDDIDAAQARLTAGGGTVRSGPHQVPGGAFVLHADDPQGGAFALVGMRRG